MKNTRNMNRRSLIQKIMVAMTGFLFAPSKLFAVQNKGVKKMNIEIHRSDSRGSADHGWLKSKHSFSFASWHNPKRMGFGLLRVVNDDQVSPSQGFGTHPHRDMEIISIPLSGKLKHKDSEGNSTIIAQGEVQLMSAGTGVFHSEYNASETDDVKFLQIWVIPQKQGITPRYDQKAFDTKKRKNRWQTVVNPMTTDEGGVQINQQAWFSMTELDQGQTIDYQTKKAGNGVYFFVIDGEIEIGGEKLGMRDAAGIKGFSSTSIKASQNTKLLAMEVPV